MTSLSKIQKRNIFGIGLFTLFMGLTIFVSITHSVLIWSLLMAIFLYHIFLPFLHPMENYLKFSRPLAASILLITFFILLALLLIKGIPLVTSKVELLQTSIDSYQKGLIREFEKLKNMPHIGNWISSGGLENLKPQKYALSTLTRIPGNLYSLVLIFILSPTITFFILRDGARFKHYLLTFVPNPIFEFISDLEAEITSKLGSFIRARILEAFFVGIVIFIGLTLFEVPHALLLSLFAGITNFLPYIGPIIGAVPPLVISIVNHEPLVVIAGVGALFIVVQFIDGFVLMPALMSRAVNLHPLIAIVSVIIGGKFLGVLGIILSIPICVVIQIVLSHLRQIQRLS